MSARAMPLATDIVAAAVFGLALRETDDTLGK
jgi:hypothetical protein